MGEKITVPLLGDIENLMDRSQRNLDLQQRLSKKSFVEPEAPITSLRTKVKYNKGGEDEIEFDSSD